MKLRLGWNASIATHATWGDRGELVMSYEVMPWPN